MGFRYKAVRNENGGTTMVERPLAEQVPCPSASYLALVSRDAFEQVQVRLRLNQERAARNTRYPEAG